MEFFDSHAHYTDERFDHEFDGGAAAAIAAAQAVGVTDILNAGTDVVTSGACIRMAETTEGLWASAGIHPSDARFCSDDLHELEEIEAMLSHPKVVAIGEIGLDYHYPDTNKEKQARYFSAQMAMAERTGMPVIIHDREAHGDCMDMIGRFPSVTGVIHSFSGSAEMARDLVRRGWYISFSGTVTFSNAVHVREAAAAVPLDRLLTETDAPYLAPVPHRGKLNHSSLMLHTIETLADIHGMSTETLGRTAAENAKRLFRIPS